MLKKRPFPERHVEPYRMPILDRSERRERAGEDVLASAHRIETSERDGYEKGFAAGEKAGYAIGEQKAQVIVGKLEALLGEVAALKERLVADLEPHVVALSFAIARRILLRELTVTPEEIVKIAREALKKVDRSGRITITVHPSLYDLFMEHRPELLSVHPDIVFDTDPSVSPTGAVVVGQGDAVVTDIDEQLDALFHGLENERGRD